MKHADYQTLRAAPGRLLRHFSIAGVGSSDLGRPPSPATWPTMCKNRSGPSSPVTAWPMLAEGVGGWFFLGANNQLLQYLHQWRAAGKTLHEPSAGAGAQATRATETTTSVAALAGSPDSDTLFRLLRDEERDPDPAGP